MIRLRALLFNIAFFGVTILLCLAWLPMLAGNRMHIVRGMDRWNRTVNWLLRHIVGLTYEVRGLEHLPQGACIVAAKHQSAWDTMIFHSLLTDPSVVLKRELLRIPIYGAFAKKVGMIPIDRSAGAAALREMLRVAQARADAGRPIVIFPEGTRVAPGERRRIHAGVAALYDRLALPVVPVALNSGLFWGRRSFVKRPGRILLEFHPPIPPGLKRVAFIARLEAAIQDGSDRLALEAGSTEAAKNSA